MYSFNINKQSERISSSPIRRFNDQISHIDDLLKLTLGEPDFNAPLKVRQAAIDAIEAGVTGYTHSRGTIELRQAIQNYLKRHYDLDYRAEDEIIVSVGATGALFAAITAVTNPGDQVIAPAPHYVIYQTQTILAGGEFVSVDVSEDAFILTPERLEETLKANPRAKTLILNHPSNPTGATYTREQLEALVPIIKTHQLTVISDEIYAELTYDSEHVSMAKLLPEQTILINGASKSHAMTGWRMGFIAAPKEILDTIFKIQQATINTPNTLAQAASVVAYNDCDEDILAMRAEYQKRCHYLAAELTRLGYQYVNPQGAFYLFVQVPADFAGNDVDFCLTLAEQAKIGVIPGSSFGQSGAGYFRISYAASMADLEEFIHRLEAFTKL
ncbi:aromatic amino acid aminotransferase [Suicoccus acidiformans]|uniref:Aminotransferase n=1 Tax=Suicoccus acidiformans TaxID=2036206 RepID=A0A347WHN6_9LACT|nr:aminotransferase class I/II-fold pyridoxal phosphate-dependent enzyme [Suicoccus acidiformans]AXY24593.1 aromatic amino acid aminotransferase [Suicoccus acidiformans]